MTEKTWTVYLSGEIHSDWRERIAIGVESAGLPVSLTAPVTVHADSDDCAAALGEPIVTLHPAERDHALKDVDAAAKAVAREPAQVVQALADVIRGELPR